MMIPTNKSTSNLICISGFMICKNRNNGARNVPVEKERKKRQQKFESDKTTKTENYLQNPANVLYIVNMLIDIKITPSRLKIPTQYVILLGNSIRGKLRNEINDNNNKKV